MLRPQFLFRQLALLLAALLLLAACGTDGGDDGTAEGEPPDDDAAVDDDDDDDDDEDEDAEDPGDDDADAESPLAGERIEFRIGYSPGGGYDEYARVVGAEWAEELGAEIVFENEPGASSLIMLNRLVTEEPDGTIFGIMPGQGVGAAHAREADELDFDVVEDLDYIGRVGWEPQILVADPDGDIQSVDDLWGASMTLSASGVASPAYTSSNVVFEAFEMDGEIITGFEGSEEQEVALQRGEIDGIVGTQLQSVEAGYAIPILAVASERMDEIPDTPALLELDLSDEARELAETDIGLSALHRLFVAPAGLPDDVLAAARDALEVAVDRAADEMAERGSPVNFLHGDEVDDLVQETLADIPQSYIDLLREAGE